MPVARGIHRRRRTMTFTVQHVHLKTRDPKQTVQFYVDNFGATLKSEIPGRGFQVDLHGLQLNITTLIDVQKHEQHYGIEHVAVQTDDYAGTLAQLRKNGVRILEELPPNNGRHVAFVECPDGAQMEVIEKV
jgi:catechol 2,3-dioxygenase-like lactoylglutathione lyase family enzyme